MKAEFAARPAPGPIALAATDAASTQIVPFEHDDFVGNMRPPNRTGRIRMRGRHWNRVAAAGSLTVALIGSTIGGLAAARDVATRPQSSPGSALAQLPVGDMKVVAAEAYRDASSAAGRGAEPVEIALVVAGRFDGSLQHVIQVNEGSEAPSASRVTVLRDGLLDDSIRSQRWEVALERTAAGTWRIKEVKQAWRCRRGAQPDRFVAVLCP